MLNRKILSDKYTSLVYKLFKENNWSLGADEDISFFDRFCKRMSELNSDEDRDLILTLSKNYLWINLDKYEKLLIDVFKDLFLHEDIILEKNNKIFICPLLPVQDFGKIKSSIFMLYICQSIFLRTFNHFHHTQVRICPNPEIIKEHIEEIGKIIIIDDFIGSGETALGCIKYFESIQIDFKKLVIVSLVAQEQGLEEIKKNRISTYTAIVRKKGISDHFPPELVKDKLDQMKRISKSIKADNNLYLGYNDCESLVSMLKTPNNTFPFYWCEKGKNTYAPFPRRDNIKLL